MYTTIAIEGVIGAGKTTIARFLSDSVDADLLLEEFEDNPFLAQFYENQEKYAFPLELSFLASRYHQARSILEKPDLFQKMIISDFVLYKSLVFASLTLKEDEAILYRRLFDIMFQQIAKPELTIYIYHTVDKLLENISQRGRSYEQDIDPQYLENLNETYLQYFKQLSDHRIVVINGSMYDIVSNPSSKDLWLDLIKREFPLGVTYLD